MSGVALPAKDVHPDLDGDPATPGHRAATGAGGEAIAASNRAVADVATEYGVSWPTARKALVAAVAAQAGADEAAGH